MNLLTENTNRLYFTFLISALSSTILTTVYSTVDIICVGQYLGPLGSAAVAYLNPFWTIMIAPGILLGVGGAVMMSNRRGAGNEKSAQMYFTLSAVLTLLCAVSVFITVYFFTSELLVFFGAEGDTLAEALKYMKPMSFAAPTFTLCASFSTFIRNDGEAFLPTFATVVGGVLNIFGDIFFVFDFGLGLGIYGAGLATAIGQIVSSVIILSYFFRKKCKLRLMKANKILARLSKIFTVGTPVFLAEFSLGLVAVVFNRMIADGLGTNHLAVYSTVSTVTILLQAIYNTLGTALQPIVSSGYGAGNIERIKTVLKTALLCAAGFGILFLLFVQLFPLEILKAYMDITDEVAKIGPSIMRKYSIMIGVSGISIVISFYLQSILKRTMSTAISVLRGFFMPLVFAFSFSSIFGIDAIWFSVPASEFTVLLISLLFLKTSNQSLKKQM
jgi:putative MATE family efflux protein